MPSPNCASSTGTALPGRLPRNAVPTWRPKASASVAANSSQGRMALNALDGVHSSNRLPNRPPATVTPSIGQAGAPQTGPKRSW